MPKPKGCACVCVLVSHVQFFATPWTIAHYVLLSIGILQARILEWVANPFSTGSSWPRDRTQVSCIAGRFFTICNTKEASSSKCHRDIQVIGLLYLQKSRVTLHTKINFKASRGLGDLSLVLLLCTETLWLLPSWAVSSLQWSSSSGFLHSQSVFSCPIL